MERREGDEPWSGGGHIWGGGERDQSEQNGNLGELLLVDSPIHPSTKSRNPGLTWIDLRESSLQFSEKNRNFRVGQICHLLRFGPGPVSLSLGALVSSPARWGR